jgi:hypothetical protein
MIVKGITLTPLFAASKAVEPHVYAKFKTLSDGRLSGYFTAKYAGAQYRATVKATGKLHSWAPCACFYGALRTELNKAGVTGWEMTLHKHKLTSGNSKHKATVALEKQGLVCQHSDVPLVPTPDKPVVKAPKPAASVTPSGKLLEFPMLAGEPLEPGDGPVSVVSLKSKARPVYAATTSLYILEECKIAALRVPSAITSEIPDHLLMRAAHAVQWRNRVVRYAEHYANTLARNFFDFLTMACYGEARYRQGSSFTFDDPSLKQGRSSAYQSALRFDPRDLLPKLVYVFNHYAWGGSYGGKKWGKIAETASLYFRPEFRTVPVAFVDHCVDLAHNGGLAFNKGYIIANPSSESSYMTMLDEKRNGSLLDSQHPHPITPDVAELLATGVSLGLVRRPRATFKIEPDANVPVLTWGSEQVKLYDGHGSITSEPITPTEVPSHVESYPVR